MSEVKDLRIGNITLHFSKRNKKKTSVTDLIGILRSEMSSVETVREIRDEDRKREEKRLQ